MNREHPLPEAFDRVWLSESELRARVRELGKAITEDYRDSTPVLVTVLRGGVVFLADLCRSVRLDVETDFLAVSAYGSPLADGAVRILKDLDTPIEGRRVIVVEDIIDTGLTLNYLLGVLRQRHPESLEVCVLFDRAARRIVDLPIAYRGFAAPDRYLVGYGLDYEGAYRNLPFVGLLGDEVFE